MSSRAHDFVFDLSMTVMQNLGDRTTLLFDLNNKALSERRRHSNVNGLSTHHKLNLLFTTVTIGNVSIIFDLS